jgi:hypothetical protein
MVSELAGLAGWYLFVIMWTVRQAYRRQPGPWPVKLGLVILLLAAIAEPGPVGEIIYGAALALVKTGVYLRTVAARRASEQ